MSENLSISTLFKEAEECLFRSQVYSFLSRSFLYPREPLLDYLSTAQESLRSTGQEELADGLEPLNLLGHSLEDRRADYLHAFGHTVNPDFPPYEMEYGNTSLYQQSTGLGDLATFYRSCGVEGASEERLDHIGVELEFMYFMSFKEAYALDHGEKEKAEICQAMQKMFLEKHLGCWGPLFLRLLERKSVCQFYQVVARVSQSFLNSELQRLGAQPRQLAETELNSRALAQKKEVAWEVEGCNEDCL